jgi:hypothetical protein
MCASPPPPAPHHPPPHPTPTHPHNHPHNHTTTQPHNHTQVRWYSFQFLMEQLEQELGQLREAVDGAAAKLPGLPRTKQQQGEVQQQGEQGEGAVITADAQQARKGAVQLNVGALEAIICSGVMMPARA